jgi:hypothetical protein
MYLTIDPWRHVRDVVVRADFASCTAARIARWPPCPRGSASLDADSCAKEEAASAGAACSGKARMVVSKRCAQTS